MLTPLDKLRSGVNDIIQIVVTTSCDIYDCSNCTQLLPFRKDYRHMSLKVFEQAIKMTKDWPGVVALFGGNPCSHPEFRQLCKIMEEYIQPQSRRGLWSNNLLGYGAIVRKTFYPDARFNLNVHKNIAAATEMGKWLPGKTIHSSVREHSWHAPILLSWNDLGMRPEDWVEAREHCDINQKWSAAVVERDGKPYAYFCEVAAALDGIKGENMGLPLTYDWWKSPMLAYRDQVRGCCDEGCGVPLRGKGHQDIDATYDVSKSFVPLTKLQKQVVSLKMHAEMPPTTKEATAYLTRDDQ